MEKEREGREGRGRRGGGEMRKGIVIGGMVIGLLMGCNNGMAELEKKNSFYESVVKIGQGFQEIFGIFGNAMGDKLGFNAVKSTDKRSAVGDHFEKVKKGLTETNNKLKELSGKMSQAKNADTKEVNAVISSASEVIVALVDSVNKLASVAKKAGNTELGYNDHASGAVGADQQDVNEVIENVNAIIKVANKSGIEINPGGAGSAVTVATGNTDAPAVLGGHNGNAAGAGAAAKLADEVAKADPWAMIDKIKGATATAPAKLNSNGNTNEAGTLAAANDGHNSNGYGAKTNADLAAAVALKAMTSSGKFRPASGEGEPVKVAAANAVNKVLRVLDDIISRTVARELFKVGKAVNGMQYSENTAEKSEATTK